MNMSETSTLVSSPSNESQDSKNPKINHQEILHNHPKFQAILTKFQNFTNQNKNTLEIEERVFPNLTGDTLAGDNKINLRTESLYFVEDYFWNHQHDDFEHIEDERDNYSLTFFHLGPKLSGHHGIVHGGLLATLLDEVTCRLAFLNFESQRGVTANLNINYKQPTYVDNYIMIKCTLIKKQGRKCWVRGDVYRFDLDDKPVETVETKENLLTTCEVLAIEPKWVDKLKTV
ncbi:uncharacterized protein J8A68_003645 [[Candida] subhashii]|uniref:Thioesterase domain-containing protein n=1 Tax=[Candida] subhashii TaxID=561895 RepID=A0A8J5QJ14_9ASCO|nr:uncharacterized protein J8A68_003645 [[Candida] subhashii]KAG7662874.1 hypothetical protein J8A68_003645 [[Candida] subhashii]